MQPTTTTTTALTVAEQLSQVPAPGAMFGVNLTNELAERLARLQECTAVTNADEYELAEARIKAAKKVLTVASEKRLGITRILDGVKTAYTTAEKEQTGELDKAVQAATSSVNAYLREQHRKQQEAEAEIRANAEKELARKRSAESKATVVAATEQKIADVQAVPTSGVKMAWIFEVEQPTRVPAAYLEVNTAAIKAAVAAGARDIPGVRIYQDVARSGR